MESLNILRPGIEQMPGLFCSESSVRGVVSNIEKGSGADVCDIHLLQIAAPIENRLGLPRPDWERILQWVGNNVAPESRDEAVWELARQWMNLLQQALPAGYQCYESTNFLILTRNVEKAGIRLLKWSENVRDAILMLLPHIANDDGLGPHVIMIFHANHTYYDYVCDFYPDEGEFGSSLGMFLRGHYNHIAVLHQPLATERTIAHELCHSLLAHLTLPLWLNEGITQMTESHVMVQTTAKIVVICGVDIVSNGMPIRFRVSGPAKRSSHPTIVRNSAITWPESCVSR